MRLGKPLHIKTSSWQRRPAQHMLTYPLAAVPIFRSVVASLPSQGHLLDATVRSYMEPQVRHDFGQVCVQGRPAVDRHLGAVWEQALPRRPIGAGLLLPKNDPLHRPLIEQSRRERGLPSDGIDEKGHPIGPSDAEIKYRGLLRAPRSSSSVFYGSFQNVAPPPAPDQSQARPGPGGAIANRAGYTQIRLQKHVSIAWDNGPIAPDGHIPLYARSVNIFFWLDPIKVLVSSDYAEGSCPYRVTLAHERSHVEAFLRIFHAGRSSLLERLNRVALPTQANPVLVDTPGSQIMQDTIGERLRQAILAHSAYMVAQMEADRFAKDTPAAYRAVYGQCSIAEWEGERGNSTEREEERNKKEAVE